MEKEMITHRFNISIETSTRREKNQKEVRDAIARALEHSTAGEAMIDALCPMGVQFDGWEIEDVPDIPNPVEGDVCRACLDRLGFKPHDLPTHGTCSICRRNYKEDAIYSHGHEIDAIRRRDKVLGLAREVSLRHTPEDLDDHVHDLKSKEASAINNAGLEDQLAYLVEQGGEDWVREVFLPKED
jgi:hypothetical protein